MTTVIVPKWERHLRAAIKSVRREAANAMRGVVWIAVLYVLMLVISKAMGGG